MSECKIEWEKFKNLVLNYIASVLTNEIIGLKYIKEKYKVDKERLLEIVRKELDNLNEQRKKVIKEIWEKIIKNEEISNIMIKNIEGIFIIGNFEEISRFEDMPPKKQVFD
jgi:single-stranded DNA-specific DHH superfamily exonuclease